MSDQIYKFVYLQLNEYETALYSIKPKLDVGLFDDFCVFKCLPVFAWCDPKISPQIKTKQFYDQIMPEVVKTGKYTEINNSFFFQRLISSTLKSCINFHAKIVF